MAQSISLGMGTGKWGGRAWQRNPQSSHLCRRPLQHRQPATGVVAVEDKPFGRSPKCRHWLEPDGERIVEQLRARDPLPRWNDPAEAQARTILR